MIPGNGFTGPGSPLLYSGDDLPAWEGSLFSGALKLRHLKRIVLSDEGG